MAYSPKAGRMEGAANRALILCLDDKEPLLIFGQTSDKTSKGGSRYLIAGLGMIERFNPVTQLFQIRGLHVDEIAQYLYGEERL